MSLKHVNGRGESRFADGFLSLG